MNLLRSYLTPSPLMAATAAAGLALVIALASLGSVGQWSLFDLQGRSMDPNITPGSVIVAREVPTDALREGDIILFNAGWVDSGLLVAHRITGISRSTAHTLAYTKGDGNEIGDPVPATLGMTARRAELVIPHGHTSIRYAVVGASALVAAFVYVLLFRLFFRLRSTSTPRLPELPGEVWQAS